MISDDKEILTLKELCELLQLHQNTVYKLARRGEIPHFRIGSGWRFRKSELLQWIEIKGGEFTNG